VLHPAFDAGKSVDRFSARLGSTPQALQAAIAIVAFMRLCSPGTDRCSVPISFPL
jgi:hypothetical protein